MLLPRPPRSAAICGVRGVLDAERAQRAALLPPGAACEACCETDPLKLDANAARVLCADHAGGPTERHHLAGRLRQIVLDLTPNWHRIVTVLQRTRREEDTSLSVALLCGIADLLYAIADYLRRRGSVDAVKSKRSRKPPKG